jgi:hypothetical protein
MQLFILFYFILISEIGVQMITFTEKLTHLKYELLMAIIHGVMIVLLLF